MNDTDATALIGGGLAAGGVGGAGWYKKRKAKRLARAQLTAVRLFPKASPLKLEREVRNILRHRKIK